ncbi:EAL domain-containing protein [Vibrio sp. JC009]|uniref:sensor domain-containing protein n=1 Tax=Vibrio sp. JC009 TaxID=2912314 RepID=UPI0023B064E0|nr:bifunctional diguanylate cyclase/phosphodiesterase [Vibrio sp. JC009]WED24493.1 EAL domain-containing protein [Vibrio sp. JC009]
MQGNLFNTELSKKPLFGFVASLMLCLSIQLITSFYPTWVERFSDYVSTIYTFKFEGLTAANYKATMLLLMNLGLDFVATATGVISFVFAAKVYTDARISNQRSEVLKKIIDAMPEPVLVKNWNGRIEYCNKALATKYGARPIELNGKEEFQLLASEESKDEYLSKLRNIINGGSTQTSFTEQLDGDSGETLHFHSVKIPIRDANDKKNLLVIDNDVTELVRLKNDADRNRQRLKSALDVSKEGLWEWNTVSNEMFHNEEWQNITGMTIKDFSYPEFFESVLEQDRPLVLEAVKDLLDGRIYDIEYRIRRPDRKVIWVWDRAKVVERNNEGKATWIVGLMQDITTQVINQEQVERLAYFDSLTGLPNRRTMEIKLSEIAQNSSTDLNYGAVLFLDLDRFKNINDSYGHQMGDNLLLEISRRLTDIQNIQNTVYRFGGDEFVVIIEYVSPQCDKAALMAQLFADEIHKQLSMTIALTTNEITIDYHNTVSIGGIIYRTDDVNPEKLLQLADLALYRVKQGGKNAAKVFDLEQQQELDNESVIQKSIRNSIRDEDFRIFVQPKYNSSNKIIGAEALVRWYHPDKGVISPIQFIDIAEESNLILPLGESIIRQSCALLKSWQAAPHTRNLSLSVNISAKQLWQREFEKDLISIVESYGIDPAYLVLEITESVLLQDVEDTVRKLNKLRSHGFRVSLDDFGTGYSSLSYLKNLPIDELKIDQSFVRDIHVDKSSVLMVKSIIDLGKNFEIQVVSEGVETEEQFNLLRLFGVHIYQGYYLSKPISLLDFENLLLKDVPSAEDIKDLM